MIVGFENTPSANENSIRGIGIYTTQIEQALKSTKKVNLIPFNGKTIPNCDLVHYPYFDLFFHTLPIKKKLPRVVTIHDVIPLVFPKHFPSGIKGKIRLSLQKQALKNTDAVICDSYASKHDIMKILGYPEEKVNVVHLAPSKEFKPVNKQLIESVKKKYKLPNSFFLFVGDVNWNKNIKGLLQEFKNIDENLVMVGRALVDENLPQTKEINELIEKLRIKNTIYKLGYVPTNDLAAIYSAAKATMVPSHYEGFGLPVLESMACATPVISAKNSSLVEVGGDVSIYFDSESIKDLSTTVKKFNALNEEEIKNLKDKSFAHSMKFSWEKTAEQTIDVYKKILT